MNPSYRLDRFLLAMLVVFMQALWPAHAAAPIEFKFGYGLKEDSNQGRAARYFASEVERRSAGRLKPVLMGAAKLGDDNAMQSALVADKQEMMVGSSATLVSLVKEMALWDAPFLFNDANEADRILDGPVGTTVMEKLKAKGLVGLVYWENGFRNLTNSKRPVSRLEDLSGMKLRVMQNDTFIKTFQLLGAEATPMPFAQLEGALRAGQIDGQENPFNTILSSRFYETQRYLTISNHVYSPWVVLASKAWWDRLSPADREVLQQAAIASRTFERQDTRAESIRALTELKAKGMQVSELNSLEVTRIRNKMDRIYSNTIGEHVGLSLMLQLQNALLELRSGKNDPKAKPR